MTRSTWTSTFILALAATACVTGALAQSAAPRNDLPQPYRTTRDWGELPPGTAKWAAVTSVEAAPDGSIYVIHRCAANSCAGRPEPPILKFDANGKLLKAFGAGMFVFPHGLFVDRDRNVWVSDGKGADGKGHTVIKFSPDGKVLMTLGTPGVAGSDATHFNAPSDILVAPNGDVFVADGHGGDTNARVVKFSRDGKFITAWGRKGAAAGEFDTPHALAMDSAGRLFVADRANDRIQIFDQAGKFLAEWKQFGRPSGLFIDQNDMLYAADSQSGEKFNAPFRQGIRIGSVKDGNVIAFIADSDPVPNMPEGVAADHEGNVYAGYTGAMNLKRFVKE